VFTKAVFFNKEWSKSIKVYVKINYTKKVFKSI